MTMRSRKLISYLQGRSMIPLPSQDGDPLPWRAENQGPVLGRGAYGKEGCTCFGELGAPHSWIGCSITTLFNTGFYANPSSGVWLSLLLCAPKRIPEVVSKAVKL